MVQDLAALAPPAIVCAAFLVGAWVIVRRELAPRRRQAARPNGGPQPAEPKGPPADGEQPAS
jgi:hypothetical protein